MSNDEYEKMKNDYQNQTVEVEGATGYKFILRRTSSMMLTTLLTRGGCTAHLVEPMDEEVMAADPDAAREYNVKLFADVQTNLDRLASVVLPRVLPADGPKYADLDPDDREDVTLMYLIKVMELAQEEADEKVEVKNFRPDVDIDVVGEHGTGDEPSTE